MSDENYYVSKRNGLIAFKKRPAVLNVNRNNDSKPDLGRRFLDFISAGRVSDLFLSRICDPNRLPTLLISLMLKTLNLQLSNLALHLCH